MEPLADFKRMVLGLPHSARDYVSVAFTADLADLFGLDLVGIFATDEGLIDLAILPCVREFRITGDGWHRLDAEQLVRGSSQAAADARRRFGDAAKTLRVRARFDLVKGQIGEAIGSQSMPDDIIVVIEPRNPAERVTHQFRQLMHVALNAAAAVLLVPSHISRRKGPVVAIATSAHDPSIHVGMGVAKSVHEKLLVLVPIDADEPLSDRFPTASAVPVDRRPIRRGEVGLPELDSLIGPTGERLVVLSRGADIDLPSRLAFERGVPVLITGRSRQLSFDQSGN